MGIEPILQESQSQVRSIGHHHTYWCGRGSHPCFRLQHPSNVGFEGPQSALSESNTHSSLIGRLSWPLEEGQFTSTTVEVAGLEPAISWSRTRRDTKLRYTSMLADPLRGCFSRFGAATEQCI